jgi:L-lysine 2,3-aminomutase
LVGSAQQFKSSDATLLPNYISRHAQVSDVLLTGGDSMVMSTSALEGYIRPLLNNTETKHLKTIRIGTKSLGYWPMRYTSDPDAKSTLQLFEDIRKSGKHVSIQAHVSHPRELQTPAAQEAIRLIRMTGAQIRAQAPLIGHINDSADLWRDM